MQPGVAIDLVQPLLPEATTVAMPMALSESMIVLSGSSWHGSENEPPPRLMLTAAMLYCGATAYTRSSAAMMSDVKAPRHGATPPQLTGSRMFENTCTAMRCALFATPEKGWPAGVPSPAAMPATCVPCRQSSSGQGA